MRSPSCRAAIAPSFVAGTATAGPAKLIWKYDRAEIIADGAVHAIGVSLGLVGAVAIVFAASNSAHSHDLVPLFIYMTGLIAMLGVSATYNMWPISEAKYLLRRFDQSAIYVLIAGTYMPFLAQMKAGLALAGLNIAIWSVAVIGVGLKLLLPDRFKRLPIVLYLLLGWSGVIAYDAAVSALPGSSVWLIAAGGVLYTTGLVFHLWPGLRFRKAIWHAFVVLAAVCHYIAVVNSVGLL
jgi:hemolysin III